MTVIVMESAPESVRGELTRWFLELKPGVFVGQVNTRIRMLLRALLSTIDTVLYLTDRAITLGDWLFLFPAAMFTLRG